MSSTQGLISLICMAITVTFVLFRRKTILFPPGPSGVPLLGIAHRHPKTEYWKTYAEWGQVYGTNGVISFHVLGRRIVVLNTAQAATRMLDKNSSIYSDRPFPTMAGLLMRREKSFFYMKYGERLKMYRKLLHQDIGPVASQKYWGIQEIESRKLALSLLMQEGPEQLEGHLRKNAAAVIMRITYGYSIKDFDDQFVAIAEESMRVASLAAAPGKWLVDALPFLRFLPSWFPGAGFRRLAEEWGTHMYNQSLIPHQYVKQQMVQGTAKPCFTANHLQPPVSDEFDDIVLWTTGALYSGAADTTTSTVKSFFFLMCLYPDVQKRAQAEVDSIIGNDRLPTLADRPRLSFLDQLISEVMRWSPPAPLGLPHSSSQDSRAITHDENIYPDPHVFNPDRFNGSLGRPQPDPRQWIFGFGRRVCPGMYIAESSIFIQVATILATLDILRDTDDIGREIIPEADFSTAIVSYIKSFPYKLRPRFETSEILLQSAIASTEL